MITLEGATHFKFEFIKSQDTRRLGDETQTSWKVSHVEGINY